MQSQWNNSPSIELPKRTTTPRLYPRCSVGSAFRALPEEHGRAELVPCIRLRGHWLEMLGFNVGARLKIDARPGCITLTVIESPSLVSSATPHKLQPVAGESAHALDAIAGGAA